MLGRKKLYSLHSTCTICPSFTHRVLTKLWVMHVWAPVDQQDGRQEALGRGRDEALSGFNCMKLVRT